MAMELMVSLTISIRMYGVLFIMRFLQDLLPSIIMANF